LRLFAKRRFRRKTLGMNTGQQHRDKNESTRCHGKIKYSGRQTLKSKN